MLGRLFAETIENMGANRMQVFTHGVVSIVLLAMLGQSRNTIDLFRYREAR